MHGSACKQYMFRSYDIYFQCFAFSWLSFHMPVQEKKTQRLKGLKFRTIIGRVQVDIVAVKGLMLMRSFRLYSFYWHE